MEEQPFGLGDDGHDVQSGRREVDVGLIRRADNSEREIDEIGLAKAEEPFKWILLLAYVFVVTKSIERCSTSLIDV